MPDTSYKDLLNVLAKVGLIVLGLGLSAILLLLGLAELLAYLGYQGIQ